MVRRGFLLGLLIVVVGGCAANELKSPCPDFGRNCGLQNF